MSERIRSTTRNLKPTSKIKKQNGRSEFEDGFTGRVFEFALFFACTLKSANECKFWLGLLGASGRGDIDTVNKLPKEATLTFIFD